MKFAHANDLLHSSFVTHSGRQFGGAPLYPGAHEHIGLLPKGLHLELGPHGDGSHGLLGFGFGGGIVMGLLAH